MVKQIEITENMKKAYLQPTTEVVLVNMEDHLLENSLNDNKSGNPDLAKYRLFDEDEDSYGW